MINRATTEEEPRIRKRYALPTIRGLMTRRILVNFRVDPSIAEALLPKPFHPQTIGGTALCGICLVSLKHLRPRTLPCWTGLASENAALRFHVEWRDGQTMRTGVFVPTRLTNSRFVAVAGGRAFPGAHERAKFEIRDSGDSIQAAVQSIDGTMDLRVEARESDRMSAESIFDSLDDASEYFKASTCGCSPNQESYDQLELEPHNWNFSPLYIEHLETSWFERETRFPAGTIEFDSAFIMRDIDHEWRC